MWGPIYLFIHQNQSNPDYVIWLNRDKTIRLS